MEPLCSGVGEAAGERAAFLHGEDSGNAEPELLGEIEVSRALLAGKKARKVYSHLYLEDDSRSGP